MTHIMRLNPLPFKMIASGEKTIELRLNDEKRRLINVGDEITFINTEDNRKTLKTVKTASPEDMLAYYSAKQQEKYGVLGIEIKVIS